MPRDGVDIPATGALHGDYQVFGRRLRGDGPARRPYRERPGGTYSGGDCSQDVHRASTCVKRLVRLLDRQLGESAVLGCQDPVRLADSEPEPDISLVRPPVGRYLTGHPQPLDIFLIEVAGSSFDDDRNIMRPLYAESGIQEFWILSPRDNCLEVNRGPRPDGTYQDIRILKPGESTDIAALPGVIVAVDDIL